MPGVSTEADLWEAIDAFDRSTPALRCEPEAAEAAHDSLESSGLLLVGEVHGVRENPLLIKELVRFFGVGGVALEWEPIFAPLVAQLRVGARPGFDDLPALWGGDGRVTAGHLAVLADLSGRRKDLSLTFMDGASWLAQPPAGRSRVESDRWLWSHRDASMAQAVLRDATDEGMLVVAGNAHTELAPIEPGVPLGAVLARERPGLRTVRIAYGEGGFYNFGPERFPRPWWQGRSPEAEGPRLLLHEGDLVLALPQPTEAVVPHRA